MNRMQWRISTKLKYFFKVTGKCRLKRQQKQIQAQISILGNRGCLALLEIQLPELETYNTSHLLFLTRRLMKHTSLYIQSSRATARAPASVTARAWYPHQKSA